MAPKGGGSKGGGSSSSGSSGGDSQSSQSVWTEKERVYGSKLTGSKFRDPNDRAIIIILGICFVAICGLAIWSFPVRKQNRPLRWAIFTCSILMAIIYFGSYLAHYILYDQQVFVMRVYFLIDTILAKSVYLAEIALLGFIQILLCNCFEGAGMSAKAKHAFVVTNWVIINIFIALWATITTFSIRLQYHLIADLSKVTVSEISTLEKLMLAYSVIFLLVGIEIMILSFRIRSGAKQRNDAILPTVPANPTKQIGTFLMSLIALPLIIRSFVEIGFTAQYVRRHNPSDTAEVVHIFFTSVATVITYIGVLLVASQFKRENKAIQGYPEKPLVPASGNAAGDGRWTYLPPAQPGQQQYLSGQPYGGPAPSPFASYGNVPRSEGAPSIINGNQPARNSLYSASTGNNNVPASNGYAPLYPSPAGSPAPPHGTAGNYQYSELSDNSTAYQSSYHNQYNPHGYQPGGISPIQPSVSPVFRENSPPVLLPVNPARRFENV